MIRYAAFLRGINLGKRRVTGEQLCAPFLTLGFTGVESFLASGNVVLTGPAIDRESLTSRIEEGLRMALGYEVATFLRTEAELESMVARSPFPPAAFERASGKLQVMLLRDEPTPAEAASVLAHATGDDLLALHGRELYWLPSGGISQSALDLSAIDRVLGPGTIRTANTLARLHAKFFAKEKAS